MFYEKIFKFNFIIHKIHFYILNLINFLIYVETKWISVYDIKYC